MSGGSVHIRKFVSPSGKIRWQLVKGETVIGSYGSRTDAGRALIEGKYHRPEK